MNMMGITEEKYETHKRVDIIACQYFMFVKYLVALISHIPSRFHCCALVRFSFCLVHCPHHILLSLPPSLLQESSPFPTPLILGTLLILLFVAHPHLSCIRVMGAHILFILFSVVCLQYRENPLLFLLFSMTLCYY